MFSPLGRWILLFSFFFPFADSLKCYKGEIIIEKRGNHKFGEFKVNDCVGKSESCGRFVKQYAKHDIQVYDCMIRCKNKFRGFCCAQELCNNNWIDLFRKYSEPEEISLINETLAGDLYEKIYVEPKDTIRLEIVNGAFPKDGGNGVFKRGEIEEQDPEDEDSPSITLLVVEPMIIVGTVILLILAIAMFIAGR